MAALERPLASYIDHTLLRPDATGEEMLSLAREAVEHGFASVCVPPSWVADVAAEIGEGSPVAVGTVVAFPFGYADPRVRLEAARRAIAAGARELDTVLNVSRLKSGDDDWVRNDLVGWVEALRAGETDVILKVILETSLLTDGEKRRGAAIAVAAGADFVKTSTGFGSAGATVEDVRLLAKEVAGKARVKASGGIRDRARALEMIAAGASRIGTSSGVAIVR